ncbi:MAG TPA: histidine kinase [bacterium]|nr:histidine kinase [bacterium]
MKKRLHELSVKFRAILIEAKPQSPEPTFQKAYQLGRDAIQEGIGVLDLALAHEGAVESLLGEISPETQRDFFRIAQQVLRESLSSFELVQAGLRDAISSLKEANRSLESEILERKKVEREVLEISQKEQRRFGAELHDGLCQKLVGTAMLLHSVLRNGGENTFPREKLQRVAQLLDESTKQARDMAHGLFPVDLQADALMLSLKSLAEQVEANHGIRCRFYCPEAILIEDNNVATHLFRIVQEATSNSRKHGAADEIQIHLLRNNGFIQLMIRDNGKANPAGISHPGIGIQIMKYRARMIAAKLEFQEIVPHGRMVVCNLSAQK